MPAKRKTSKRTATPAQRKRKDAAALKKSKGAFIKADNAYRDAASEHLYLNKQRREEVAGNVSALRYHKTKMKTSAAMKKLHDRKEKSWTAFSKARKASALWPPTKRRSRMAPYL